METKKLDRRSGGGAGSIVAEQERAAAKNEPEQLRSEQCSHLASPTCPEFRAFDYRAIWGIMVSMMLTLFGSNFRRITNG